MTKVRDLIEGSTFIKADGFDYLTPQISIILPTFRRGDNGLFKKCIDSLLNQSFKNFEIIIIDDASTDSTEQQISNLIKIDSRFSSIRHSKNIGLPAISCNEGIIKSRSNKIFFAFDDNFYKKNTLEELWCYQEKNPDSLVTYATTNIIFHDGSLLIGDKDFDLNKIFIQNYIPNSPMMIDKRVFNDVGLYDPHVCITRLCDWDLWIRIAKKYSFSRIHKTLSTETGPIQKDSLGNSYIYDSSLIREWISQNRNESLKPQNFIDYNVSAIPSNLSNISKIKIEEIIQKKFPYLLEKTKKTEYVNNKYALLIVDNIETSAASYLSDLPEDISSGIIILTYENIKIEQHLDLILGSSFVILTKIQDTLSQKLENLISNSDIPYYYFFSDNLLETKKILSIANSDIYLRKSLGIFIYNYGSLDIFKETEFENKLIIISDSDGSQIKNLFIIHQNVSFLDFCLRLNSINLLKNKTKKYNLKNLIATIKKTIIYYAK